MKNRLEEEEKKKRKRMNRKSRNWENVSAKKRSVNQTRRGEEGGRGEGGKGNGGVWR